MTLTLLQVPAGLRCKLTWLSGGTAVAQPFGDSSQLGAQQHKVLLLKPMSHDGVRSTGSVFWGA